MGPTVLVFTLAAAVLAPLRAEEAPRGARRQEASADLIRGWLQNLDADVFMVRETATDKLIEAGSAAVAPVAAVAAGGSLELVTRGVFILRELALSSDYQTQDLACKALQDLAAVRVTAAARRAAAALTVLEETRQERAVSELRRLGAKLGPADVPGLLIADALLEVEIGERWRGGEEDLRRLSWLRDYRSVKLAGEQVRDSWFKYVGAMNHVSRVVVSRASISDAALAHLDGLKELQELELRYTPVGDGAVPHLQTHKSAGAIRLYGTAITKQGAQKLADALAGAAVDHRRGGFLGVGCQQHLLGCEVAMLHEGSAAADAGIERHDVILKYDGKKTPDFQTLTQLISAHQAGQIVAVEILRGGETLTKRVTLGEWMD